MTKCFLIMVLLEPFVISGLDQALLKLLLIFCAVLVSGLVVITSSIIGLVRTIRRRRRGVSSKAAVMLAAITTAITTCWLLYWVGADIYQRSNPLDALLVINLAVCVPPLTWLVVAIRANAALGKILRIE